jgi:outer membrane receptor protein involved in Fe transport
LDLNWAAHKMLEWTGSVYTGARGPTLNELYRPFRAGDVSTLANPSLQPESLFGGELEMRVRPLSGLNGALRIFANRLRDTIANLTRVTGPGVFPPWGTLPLGATGARRENIERVDISGIEARLEWRFSEQWVIRANALGTHSRVRECVLAPGLTGKQLPQMPRAQLGAQIEGHEGPWKGLLAVRHVGAQFEDDANRFVLRPFWTLDARVGRAVGKRSEIFVSGENLTNSEIQTRRDSSGIVALGMPRLWSAGLRLEF